MDKAPALKSCPHCGNETFNTGYVVMSGFEGRKDVIYCSKCLKLCSITVGELVFRYAGKKGE